MKNWIIGIIVAIVVVSGFLYLKKGLIIGGFVYFNNTQTSKNTNPPPPNSAPPSPTTSGKTVTIEITADGFVPDKITIQKNDTVTFKNVDTKPHWPASNIHPTHDIYPEFDSMKGIPAGESWSFTFDKAGIWRMHDHLYATLVGTITVTE